MNTTQPQEQKFYHNGRDYTSEEFKSEFPQESDYDMYEVMDSTQAAFHYCDTKMDERVQNVMNEYNYTQEKYHAVYACEKEDFVNQFYPGKKWNSAWGYHFRKDGMVEVRV